MNDGDVIKYRFLRSVFRELEEDRSDSVHVTDLVYGCMRRAYYSKVLGESSYSDEAGALVLWIGKKLHETVVCEGGHEVALELKVEGVIIRGSIDELCKVGDYYVIVDKKSVRRTPSSPYAHHVKQVKYYSAMLSALKGIEAKKGIILYINVADLVVKPFEFELSAYENLTLMNEIIDKAKKLWDAVQRREVPDANPSWLCQYCPFWKRCVVDGGRDV